MSADLILKNGRFTTLDRSNPTASAVAITNGVFTAVGRERDVMPLADASTRIIDLKGRRALPGLIDNHLHIIRGGLNFNMELRWDGVRSLADAMAMLKRQVAITPPPQWVRVVGGFTAHQFEEKRLPTIEEINAVAPDTPVFLLHLYDRALLNGAALRAVGYTKDTPDPPAGEIVRDAAGNPTGSAARQAQCRDPLRDAGQGPEAAVRISAQLDPPLHARAQPARRDRRDRCRRRLPELSGGLRGHPQARAKRAAHRSARLQPLHAEAEGREGRFPELDEDVEIQAGQRLLPPQRRRRDAGLLGRRLRGLPPAASRHAAGNGRRARGGRAHPGRRTAGRGGCTRPTTRRSRARSTCSSASTGTFRSRASTGSSIMRRRSPIDRSTVSRRSAAASPCSTAWPTRANTSSSATARGAAEATPPVAKMLQKGIKVSAGTDATRVASYNPWVSLAWLVTGKTVGGMRLYPQRNCLDRETALRMWTENVTWFSNEEGKKGRIEVGQFADLIVPDRDYFSCPEDEIADTTSDLTIVGGKVVYGAGDFAQPTMKQRRRRRCRTGRRCGPSVAMRRGAIPRGEPRFIASSP